DNSSRSGGPIGWAFLAAPSNSWPATTGAGLDGGGSAFRAKLSLLAPRASVVFTEGWGAAPACPRFDSRSFNPRPSRSNRCLNLGSAGELNANEFSRAEELSARVRLPAGPDVMLREPPTAPEFELVAGVLKK